jgi:hypothetical protein
MGAFQRGRLNQPIRNYWVSFLLELGLSDAELPNVRLVSGDGFLLSGLEVHVDFALSRDGDPFHGGADRPLFVRVYDNDFVQLNSIPRGVVASFGETDCDKRDGLVLIGPKLARSSKKDEKGDQSWNGRNHLAQLISEGVSSQTREAQKRIPRG